MVEIVLPFLDLFSSILGLVIISIVNILNCSHSLHSNRIKYFRLICKYDNFPNVNQAKQVGIYIMLIN